MKCRYPDRDLTARLDNSICRYQGVPVYIRHTDANELTLYLLNNLQIVFKRISSDDEDLDISTIPMGYYQYTPRQVVYVSRRPVRRWKQGVEADALDFKFLNVANARHINIYTKAFEDMVMGRYPSLEETLKNFESSEETMEIAIHRDVVLEYLPNLKLVHVHYKGEEVGFLILGTKTVIVPSSERAWVISYHLSGFTWEVK